MNSKSHSNTVEKSQQKRASVSGGPNKARDQFKHVQDDLDVMRNRVHLLKQQLQKEKDSIRKHKNMTQQVVKKKAEINKVNALKNRDNSEEMQRISHIRRRNYSYREKHKEEMNNILKAIYLVKLDEARGIKEASLEHKKSREELMERQKIRQKQHRREITQQSEQAKARYIEYWKNKLNSIYTMEQRALEEQEAVASEKKKQLHNLHEQEIELLNEIKKLQMSEMEAKKEYMAALSLSSREVGEAMREEEKSKDKESLLEQSRSESIRYSRIDKLDVLQRASMGKMLSSNDITLPRTKVDQQKFQIVLKQLRKMEEMDRRKK